MNGRQPTIGSATTAAEPDRPRGAHLLEAVFSVLAEDGLGALSMRSVAAAANVSVAQVQYYFRTKAELVAAAFTYASSEFLDALATVEGGEPSVEHLRAVIWTWLPLDEQRERRARVWLAFAAISAADRELARAAAQLDTDLRMWFTQQFTALRDGGRIRADVDVTAASAQLLALIDGTTIHALVVPMRRRRVIANQTLGVWLDHLAPAHR